MKKLALTTLAIFLAACSAENTTSDIQDNVAETTQQAEIAAKALAEKEAMAAQEMAAKEMAQKDALAKEAAAKALAEKEALAKETAAKALAEKEASAKEAAAKALVEKEAAAKAAIARETAANEAAAQEAAAKEAARIDAIKQEEARQEAARLEVERQAAAAQAYRVLSSGTWRKKSFSVSGNWTLSAENGVTTVALDNAFSTRKAPDLKIFLSPLSADQLNGGNATQGSLLVSPLSSNKGAQKYNIPAGTNLSQYKTILIHCEAFSKLWSVSAL